ncbi:MAG TPA: TIGR02302 family protein [Hyphomicrobiaceae bacterium]|nr:TIGR02302 family protein [Hyphomicrobiaceae bacterium]
MAAQQGLPPGDRTPTPAFERAFERKVRLSKWALLFEQLWPRAWVVFALAGLFIGVSLAGLWPRLPELPHKIVLSLFALAFAVALIALARVRWPSREAAVRRVEAVSGIKHRPASSYEDTLTLGAEDARTAALWRAHRLRLAALLQKLRVGPPSPRTDRRDPFALRALLLLAVFVLLVMVGDSASDRLSSAFRFGALAKGAEARIDAWVTPPAYTAKPPIMLADGGFHAVRPQDQPAGPFEVPDRSVLVVRASGAALGALALEAPGANGEVERLAAPEAASSGDVSEIKLELRRSGTVTVYGGGARLLSWPFTVTPDNPPRIALTKDVERTPRGGLKLHFKVEDDYGVVSAETRMRRVRAKEDTTSTAWARTKVKGPRPPYERPPALVLRLPRAYPKAAEGQSFHEIGDHMWAGMRVELTLLAKDLAGQTGRSEAIEIVLPERRFSKPLARAVVEQRRLLAEDPRERLQVARALDALTVAPEGFIDDLQVYLGLRSAYWRLQRETSRSARNSVIDQLWNIALRIEDGNLSDAERALRAAQERLSKALEEGATDEEIQKLMQELRQALAQFLEQLARQAQNQPPVQGMDRNSQFMTPQDIEQMLRNLENMARSGDRNMAQQMLSQLRDLLDRLQSGRMADQGQNQRFSQMMDEFGNLLGQQQQLLDDTFSQQRRQGERGQRGQRGQQGQRGQGQQGQQGQGQGQQPGDGQGDQLGALGDRQRQLRDMLGRLQRGLSEFGLNAPGQLEGAGEAMERAERALREGDLEGATQEEARALEQLRQGAREMAQQMLSRMPSRFGLNDSRGELDPMGRPPQRTEGPDPGVGVKVPDQIDVQRAREILEELRRRLGEPTRQPLELEYLERLLKRF